VAPTQEGGLRENCTSCLSERAEAGRKPHLSRLYSREGRSVDAERHGGVASGFGGRVASGFGGNLHQPDRVGRTRARF